MKKLIFLIVCLRLCIQCSGAATERTELEPISDQPVDIIVEKEQGEECSGEPYNFSVYDYLVVCGMLVISVGIGVFYGFFEKKESVDSFLMGSDMSVWTVALSIMTSFITAIELLGNPAEIYYNGFQYSLIVLSLVLVIPVAAFIFYPIYFKMQLSSCYEYLGVRFDKKLRIFGAILYILQMSFYTSVAVLAPAIALNKATGLNTHLAVVFIYVVCVFYASQGGMKAVVIADTFQAVVLGISLILVIALGSYYSENISEIFTINSEAGRLHVLEWNPDPTVRHSVFSVVIGGFFYWSSLFCTNQAAVQKGLSLKKLHRANNALIWAVVGVIIIFGINFYNGLLLYLEYGSCDPLMTGEITASDQILPYYVMDVFGKITSMTGIFVAGIFAASLGTVAAALNSLATVTLEDVVVTGFNVKIPVEKGATIAKWLSLGFGVASFLLVFIVERMGGILQVTLTLNGLIGGVTLGLFSVGIFFKRANSTGTFFGGILSLLLVVFVGIMAQFEDLVPEPLQPLTTDNCPCSFNSTIIEDQSSEGDNEYGFSIIYRISYLWYPFLGAILTIIFSIILSYIDQIIKYQRMVHITSDQGNVKQTSIDQISITPIKGVDNRAYITE